MMQGLRSTLENVTSSKDCRNLASCACGAECLRLKSLEDNRGEVSEKTEVMFKREPKRI